LKLKKRDLRRATCLCNKPLSINPSHKYCLTQSGIKEFNRIQNEDIKRNYCMFPGWHLQSTLNRVAGYYLIEVFENNFVSFNKELCENNKMERLWPKIEGIGMWLGGDLQPWFRE
jgi:hypothetical protein